LVDKDSSRPAVIGIRTYVLFDDNHTLPASPERGAASHKEREKVGVGDMPKTPLTPDNVKTAIGVVSLWKMTDTAEKLGRGGWGSGVSGVEWLEQAVEKRDAVRRAAEALPLGRFARRRERVVTLCAGERAYPRLMHELVHGL